LNDFNASRKRVNTSFDKSEILTPWEASAKPTGLPPRFMLHFEFSRLAEP
jgi:hypothetical protein